MTLDVFKPAKKPARENRVVIFYTVDHCQL